jgi:pyridoxine 4-dehydrogenase
MRQDGLIRHIGLSNVSADQLRSALSITDVAAVTVHYNVAVRLGAAVRQVAVEAGIVFSPWHPGVVPGGDQGVPFHAVIDPIAAAHISLTPDEVDAISALAPEED